MAPMPKPEDEEEKKAETEEEATPKEEIKPRYDVVIINGERLKVYRGEN